MPAPTSFGGSATSAPSISGTNRVAGASALLPMAAQGAANQGGFVSRPGHAQAFQGMAGPGNLWSMMGGYDPGLFMQALQGMLPGGMYGQMMGGSQDQYSPFSHGYGKGGGYGI